MTQSSTTIRVYREELEGPSGEAEAGQHKRDSPEFIRAEVDAWAAEDPYYKAFIEGVRETLRGRDNKVCDRTDLVYSR